jgi:hypothetical protein
MSKRRWRARGARLTDERVNSLVARDRAAIAAVLHRELDNRAGLTRIYAARDLPALNAAADVVVVRHAPEREHVKHVKRAKGWLFPLATAASVVVIAVASVIVAHLASPTGTQGRPATGPRAPRPEFYMTATYSLSGPNVLRLQVRRTADGAVTASTSIPATHMGWDGHLTAAASDRAFYIARYPYLCPSTTAVAVTTFYRITITGSGRISAIAAVGHTQGMVTELAVSPDGSQLAYSALPGQCPDPAGLRSPAAGGVSILNLSTGAVRTWQDATRQNTAGGLSWAPARRTLVIDEYSPAPGGRDLTVFGLDTTSGGGSLQAHSRTLLRQNSRRNDDCSSSACVTAVLAGPHDSLTALEYQRTGQQARVLVVSIPLAAGRPQTVLYSESSDSSKGISVNGTGLFADSSGQWMLLWPAMSMSRQEHAGGWISGGRLHPLPGVADVFPQGIAW